VNPLRGEPAVLDVRDVTVVLGRGHRILRGVDLTVAPREILGVIGETGAGKTTLARTIVGLVEPVSGEVRWGGERVSRIGGRARRALRRAGQVQYVFQDPLRSLDPDLTVRRIVGEGLAAQGTATRAETAQRIREAVRQVGLDLDLLDRYPAQLSGGQRQRVAIARALVMRPGLLICDEPVSALDASNRNKILRLLDELRSTVDMSIVVISHDLGSLSGIADRVAVLYGGRIVEEGPVPDLFLRPRHPYTGLLVASAPSVRADRPWDPRSLRLVEQPSTVDESGCVFASRCRFRTEDCAAQPEAREVAPGWRVSCHHESTWRDRARRVTRERQPT
jgi:oligopeptide/dipeptide ABC transporter ATP-binding protein